MDSISSSASRVGCAARLDCSGQPASGCWGAGPPIRHSPARQLPLEKVLRLGVAATPNLGF